MLFPASDQPYFGARFAPSISLSYVEHPAFLKFNSVFEAINVTVAGRAKVLQNTESVARFASREIGEEHAAW